MEIGPKKAAEYFYDKKNFEQIYIEAVANALDAGAKNINIEICYADTEVLSEMIKLKIVDDGIGFTDDNYSRFAKLMENKSEDHKGLGRLAYLTYFDRIEIKSVFAEGCRYREFVFDDNFKEHSGKETAVIENGTNGTILEFSSFCGEKLHTYNYIRPAYVKQMLLDRFFPRWFEFKITGARFNLRIVLSGEQSKIDDTSSATLTEADIIKMEHCTFSGVDLYEGIEMLYLVENNVEQARRLSVAIWCENQIIPYKFLQESIIPEGYQVKFIFKSNYFTGKTNVARSQLLLTTSEEVSLRNIIEEKIAEVLEKKIERIAVANRETVDFLDEKYPYLEGYFPVRTVGLMDKKTVILQAQNKFFVEQREVLECQNVDEGIYQKALDGASRLLAAYVLYRTKIISRLKSFDTTKDEAAIHNLIVPRFRKFSHSEDIEDVFRNNAWLLDDKYMSYTTVLSEKNMKCLVEHLDETKKGDEGRADITLVFSQDPDKAEKVDVVVVELKKHGVGLVEKANVLLQLKSRAQVLLEHCYPGKINRMWYYGITDIDLPFSRELRSQGFAALFSKGEVFYKRQTIVYGSREIEQTDEIDLFVLTYEALINDAESRNDTFLRLLRASLKEHPKMAQNDAV